MPRQVDHEERRARIADAVCQLLARHGLEGVSLRHVATQAGISMGQVQHYFTTKDEMLVYTFDSLSARVERRLQNAFSGASGEPPSTKAVLRALLRAMVPLDQTSRSEAPLWIAYLARAVVRPELAQRLRSGDPTAFVADLLRDAQRAGQIADSLDADIEAASLLALADGLMLRTTLDPNASAAAETAIDYHLDRIFSPSQGRDRS